MDNRTALNALKKSHGKKIYIYGNGTAARRLEKYLMENGIYIDDCVVDDKKETEKCLSRAQLLERGEEYILIRGHGECLRMAKEDFLARWPGCLEEYAFPNHMGSEWLEDISAQFYFQHKHLFDRVRDNTADERSKKTLDAYLEEKITGDNKNLLQVFSKKQYFVENPPWNYTDSEVFVDCGAYDGDTIKDFVEACGRAYERIVAFEPDDENFANLCRNIADWQLSNVEALKKGAFHKSAELHFFSGEGPNSMITREGRSVVYTDSIDSVLNGGRATIIKMDIEGAEKEALIGAEKTIKHWRPILMICAYHKRDDIYAIYDLIDTMVSGYSYYFRHHAASTDELVLYAVPNERVIR